MDTKSNKKNHSFVKAICFLLLLHSFTAQAEPVVTKMVGGWYNSFYFKSDGSFWGAGLNGYGVFGDGTFSNAYRPRKLSSSGTVSASVGAYHTLFIKSDGGLWATGWDSDGELGDGSFYNGSINVPKQIVTGGVVAVGAGYRHSLFLKSDGSAWGMGFNNDGELGIGNTNSVNQPALIIPNGVSAISTGCGGYHSLFLKSDGSVWGTGYNGFGALGDGTYTNSIVPKQIIAGGVTAIAAGGSHSLFLKSDGSLWATGDNFYGQLGDGTFNSKTNNPEQIVSSGVVAIATGYSHSLFLKSDGSLWGMGYRGAGQLGDGQTYPISVRTPELIVSQNVVMIAAGANFSLFVKSDGSLWAMGENGSTQLGDGFTDGTPSLVPELISPLPPPVLTYSIFSKTNMQFQAPCQFGGVVYLRSTTNLAQPSSQWSKIATNIFSSRGNTFFSATVSNAVSKSVPQRFYILHAP